MKDAEKPDDIDGRQKDLSIQDAFNPKKPLKNADFPSEPQTCVLCKNPIIEPSQRRSIHFANKEFSTHRSCLEQLHTLLRSAFTFQPPTPTLCRTLTLAEFLLTKHPQNEPEVLACIAYYLQSIKGRSSSLRAQEVAEYLRYTGFKIQEPEIAFQQAEKHGFFQKLSQEKKIAYRLTKKGSHLVEQLPSPDR